MSESIAWGGRLNQVMRLPRNSCEQDWNTAVGRVWSLGGSWCIGNLGESVQGYLIAMDFSCGGLV